MKTKIPYLMALIVATASLSHLADIPALRASPLLSLETISGSEIDLAESQGKARLVSFWAPDCPISERDIPTLSQLHQEFSNNELEIIAVAMPYSIKADIHSQARQKSINYPIVHDTDGSISKSFPGVRFTPTTFLIDSEGTIVWRHVGKLDQQKVAGHISEVKLKQAQTLAKKDQ